MAAQRRARERNRCFRGARANGAISPSGAMKIFDNPDFRNLAPEVMRPFLAAGDMGFFDLPQWFGLIADCRVNGEPAIAGVAIDEHSGIAIVYGKTSNAMELNSLTNLYTCSYDLLGKRAGHDAVAAFAKAFASR